MTTMVGTFSQGAPASNHVCFLVCVVFSLFCDLFMAPTFLTFLWLFCDITQRLRCVFCSCCCVLQSRTVPPNQARDPCPRAPCGRKVLRAYDGVTQLGLRIKREQLVQGALHSCWMRAQTTDASRLPFLRPSTQFSSLTPPPLSERRTFCARRICPSSLMSSCFPEYSYFFPHNSRLNLAFLTNPLLLTRN